MLAIGDDAVVAGLIDFFAAADALLLSLSICLGPLAALETTACPYYFRDIILIILFSAVLLMLYVGMSSIQYVLERSAGRRPASALGAFSYVRPGIIYAFTRSVHLSASVAHVKLNFTCGTEQVIVLSTSRVKVFTVFILIRILALLTWMLMEMMKKTVIVVMMKICLIPCIA